MVKISSLMILAKISSLLTEENFHGRLTFVTINQEKITISWKYQFWVVTWLEKIQKIQLSAVLNILYEECTEVENT